MINLNFDSITGTLTLNDLPVEIETEDVFCKSQLYQKLFEQNSIKSITPHHYLIDSVRFFDKEFEFYIRPICYDFPFVVQLVDKHGGYYKSLNDWSARTNINMLNDSVVELSNWLKVSLNLLTPDLIKNEMVRWDLKWGRVSVSYETKSFNHGIYISWENIA
ncbi:hypothetical protein [Pantoea sp. FN0307]|uniref:hypothetical protein n=1 Tax=Pantoea sp. FN0307 TaxID=3418560 RepID=UPI003CF27A37